MTPRKLNIFDRPNLNNEFFEKHCSPIIKAKNKERIKRSITIVKVFDVDQL
jgi:hypothetical protein